MSMLDMGIGWGELDVPAIHARILRFLPDSTTDQVRRDIQLLVEKLKHEVQLRQEIQRQFRTEEIRHHEAMGRLERGCSEEEERQGAS